MELSLEKLESLYKKFGREYAPGSVVFMEDSCGDEMFIILDGEIEVTKTYREFEFDKSTRLFSGTNTQTLGILKRGDFFGEMALLNDLPRSATARALTKAKLICVGRENFNLIIGSANPLVLQILKSLSGRLRDANRYPHIIPRAQTTAEPVRPPAAKRPAKKGEEAAAGKSAAPAAAPAEAPAAAPADKPRDAPAADLPPTPAAKPVLQSRLCPQCNSRADRDAKFCRECGTRLHLS